MIASELTSTVIRDPGVKVLFKGFIAIEAFVRLLPPNT